MLVDDEADILSILNRFLTRWGYSVAPFGSAKTALDAFKSNASDFSLILTDVRMPGMNGIELAKKVRDIESNAKIVMMTAFEMDDTICNSLPFVKKDDIIHKPVRLTEVCTAVKKQLGIQK